MAATFTKQVPLEYLLYGLVSAYNTVLQPLDANPSHDVYEKLEILERNEKRLYLNSKVDAAHVTRANNNNNITGKPKSRQRGKDH
ncbi:hypothetical protein K3495_g1255 [Podosphaera aphanis]|nr:hypothetical protein K3495_g1255 [Podosphaera aphanis]